MKRRAASLTGAVVTALLLAPVVGVLSAEGPATAKPGRGEEPCTATGADPSKQKIHVAKNGKPRKLKNPENSGKLFGKARPDRQKEDQERNVAEVVRISGYSATVVSAGFVQSVSEFEEGGYIKLTVKVCNRDEEAQPYSEGDWRLQTPAGTVIDPTFVSAPTLGYLQDLVRGGEITGDVFFEIDGQVGDFFVLYKPDPFDASRGIWKVTV